MGIRFVGKCFCYLLVLLCGIAHANNNTVTYVYTDPQGTPLAEADANGNITATFDYMPYGSQALGSPPNGPGYTGHVNDPDTGLVYMLARYYDPATGRFLSVDPVAPKAANVFNFGRYVYGNNNPIRNTDPNGKQVFGSAQDAVTDNSEGQANAGIMMMCGCDPIYTNMSGTGEVQNVITPMEFAIGDGAAGALTSLTEREAVAVSPAISGGPKSPANFITPTNPPQLPPDTVPDGYSVRTMPNTTVDYAHGYWVMTDKGGNPINPATGKQPGSVSKAVSRSQTHVPLPPPKITPPPPPPPPPNS